jgi:DNA-binding transcriptional MocR family regulator
MAQWLAKMTGEAVDPARLIITNGAQHALLCAILATCKSGDTLACEQLTYAGLKVVAPTLGIHLLPLAMDRDGIIPEELARACAANSIRGLVCVPNLQNPTTITMPAERRERIAHIARSNNIVVIEDDVYGALAQNGLPALRTFYPEGVLTLTGISKSLGPGLRVGAVIAAEQYHPGLTNAVRATAWMASPIDVSVVVEMMHTGLADDIVARNQDELKKRALIVSDALAMLGCHVDSRSPHAWLELPEPWTKEQFLTWLASAHIQALPSDTFVVGREFVSHAVRLSLTCLKDRSELQDAVRRIAIALQNGPAQSMLMA